MSVSLSWLERCPLAIAVIERSGSVLYWSSGAERLTGWKWEEVVGRKSGLELFSHRVSAMGLFRQLRREGRVDGRILAIRGRDSRPRTLALSVAPLFARGGEAAAYLTFAQEVAVDSALPSLVDGAGERSAIVEQLHQGILIEDADGYITYANQEASRLFGFPLAQLLGMHWRSLVPSSEREDVGRRLQTRREGQARVYETRIQRRDGAEIPVLVNARPQFKNARFSGVLSEFSDLGQVRGLERRLRRAEGAGARAIMLQALAHDLCNLLATVLPQAEMLAVKASECEQTEFQEQADTIQSALRKGRVLVQQLADFRSQPDETPAALNVAAELRSVESLLTRVAGSHVDFMLSVPEGEALWAKIHAVELQQILFNLVNNASFATRHQRRGHVELSLAHGKAANVGPALFIVVEDDGAGIDDETLTRIFEPFVTSKGSTEGSGLGLFMVRKLTEERGGSINVRSIPGRGSRFEITIPECLPPARPAVEEDGVNRLQTILGRILVVEDEPELGVTMAQALTYLGHEATIVCSGREAIARALRPDVSYEAAIIDAGLPDIDGRDLKVQLERRCPEIKTMLCSGNPPRAEEQVLYLRKPFTLSELEESVQELLTVKPSLVGPDGEDWG